MDRSVMKAPMSFQSSFWDSTSRIDLAGVVAIIQSPRTAKAGLIYRDALQRHPRHSGTPAYKCIDCQAVDDLKWRGGILTPGGYFLNRRTRNALVTASGLAVYDVEDFRSADEMKEVRQRLQIQPHVALVSTSMSGMGLWVLLCVPVANAAFEYTRFWFAGLELLQGVLGVGRHVVAQSKGQQDVTRCRFLAPDPDLYINPDAVEYAVPEDNRIPEYIREDEFGYTYKVYCEDGIWSVVLHRPNGEAFSVAPRTWKSAWPVEVWIDNSIAASVDLRRKLTSGEMSLDDIKPKS